MTKHSPFGYFKTSTETIRLAVMLYMRFPLSLSNVEDLLHERGAGIEATSQAFLVGVNSGQVRSTLVRQVDGSSIYLLKKFKTQKISGICRKKQSFSSIDNFIM